MNCIACEQTIVQSPSSGVWYHRASGLRGWVDDPTGTDAAHRAIPENPIVFEQWVCEDCGNPVQIALDPDFDKVMWAEVDSWGDERDYQCGMSDDYRHHGVAF